MIDVMTYYEAGVSEEGEPSTLQGDEAGTVGGQTEDALVGQVAAVGDTDVAEAGAALAESHQTLVLDIPAALEVDIL